MKIREFQHKLAESLNSYEELVQGGCKALAEDSLSVMNDVKTQLQTAGGVAIVVTTPKLSRNGCAAGVIPADTRLAIRCIELPALNRENPGHLTALDAAELVAQALDGEQFNFAEIAQTVDQRTGTLTAEVIFNTTIHL